ncbi:MAG: hypothetical protein Q8O25_04185 [Sulfurisoma sp.]|nr:hypothetical protein [Sulfurisoma sp.]
MKLDLRKIYRFDPIARNADGSLPSGGDIYYECTGCKDVVSSVPHIVARCECGNLSGKGGKVEITAPDKVNPVRGKLK